MRSGAFEQQLAKMGWVARAGMSAGWCGAVWGGRARNNIPGVKNGTHPRWRCAWPTAVAVGSAIAEHPIAVKDYEAGAVGQLRGELHAFGRACSGAGGASAIEPGSCCSTFKNDNWKRSQVLG